MILLASIVVVALSLVGVLLSAFMLAVLNFEESR
jgi:hypothetical protein